MLAHGTSEFGSAFEHFISLEIRAYLSYKRINEPLQYWRTRSHEVDFLIGDVLAVEVKSAEGVNGLTIKCYFFIYFSRRF